MKKNLILAALLLVAALPLRADEGMWLPVLISQRRVKKYLKKFLE